MTLEPVMLDITEDALEELIATHSRHHAMLIHYTSGPSPRRYRDGIVGEAAAADRAACWLRLVSTVEIYAETLLRHLDGEDPHPVPSGWGEVKKALKGRHTIDVNAIDAYARLEACFTVRNAVAHGLGRFTANQLRQKNKTPGSLRHEMRVIGVPVRDGAVVITSEALAGCAEICRVFVAALDAALGDQRSGKPR